MSSTQGVFADPRGSPAREAGPSTIVAPWLPEPMLAYRCNLAGCCCAVWRIFFTDRDLARLAEHLPRDEVAPSLRDGLICVVDRARNMVDHFLLSLRGEQQTCRFLSPGGACTIQQRFGVAALPDICVDFPVIAWQLGEQVELGFTTLCPSVLDALLADGGPLRIVPLPASDAMFHRRLERVRVVDRLTLGGVELEPAQLYALRQQVLRALEDVRRPALDHLQAVSYGFSFMIRTGDPAAFELRYDMPPLPFVRFLNLALQTHAGSWLAQCFSRYRRFVRDPELLRQLGSEEELAMALEHWQEPLVQLVEPVEEQLRPYLNRFLAMRYFSCLARFEGEVVLTMGRVTHLLATALRYAAAFCARRGEILDLATLKAALGAASFVHHNDHLVAHSLVWFLPEQFASDEPPSRQLALAEEGEAQ